MATLQQQVQGSWKDRAIAKSEGITDLWEVTKVYAGRIAEWVLFLCMVVSIIEMLPGVSLAAWFTSTILGVQVVMLDVGGFSLASMAKHAKENGDEKAAGQAAVTGWFLIGMMILTLLLVSIGLLFPSTKTIIDGAEKGLILLRVVMTVVYGHVIHSLRSSSGTANVQQQVPAIDVLQRLDTFTKALNEIEAGTAKSIQAIADKVSELYTQQAQIADRAVDTVDMDVYRSLSAAQDDKINKLSELVFNLAATVRDVRVSVTEVNQNVLQFTQNVYASTPGERLEIAGPAAYPTTVDQCDPAHNTSALDAPDVPCLDVPGIAAETVKRVLVQHLSGTPWRDCAGNYSRTVKPVKEAYEQWQAAPTVDQL